jgi:hypothetical protein
LGTVSAGFLSTAPAISVFGSTGAENVYLIDGLDTTNPYWGAPQTVIPLDSIQEISFETGGFGAELGRATGGVINAITKSGSNDLSGTLDLRYFSSDLESSGDHYNADEQDSSGRILSGSLGGRFVRDRAWYFATVESIEWDETPYRAQTTLEGSIIRGFAKVTGQAGPRWLGVGKYHKNPFEWRNVWADQFVSPEADGRLESEETILQAEVSAVLTDSLLWEFQLGSQEFREDVGPMGGDSSAFAHFNTDTGMWTGNDTEQFFRDAGREQLGMDLAWLVDDALGSHELKLGAEYQKLSQRQHGCFTGIVGGGWCQEGGEGFIFFDVNGLHGEEVPWAMWVRKAIAPFEIAGAVPSIFLQNSWRVLPQVSLNLGLRWDRAVYENDVGDEVANFEMLQPRLGVAWDPTRNGRNILRASWGRYMHPSFLRLPRLATTQAETFETWLSCSWWMGMPDPRLCEQVAAGFGAPFRLDPQGWEPAGWFLSEAVGSDPTVIAPGLEPTYADHLILGYERELFRRTSLELSFVDKVTRDIFDDTCVGNYPTPTAGADCSAWIIPNIPQARRDYRAWILRFDSRALDRFHVLASYNYSDSKGSIESARLESGDFDHYPWAFENRYGYLGNHQRHRIKISGYTFFPWDFSLAFSGLWGSPFRWTPLDDTVEGMPVASGSYFVEPRGSREGSDSSQLDLQLAKGFGLGAVRLRLVGTVINVFDSENPTLVCNDVDGCGDYELGDPIEWQQPRRFELGLRLEF